VACSVSRATSSVWSRILPAGRLGGGEREREREREREKLTPLCTLPTLRTVQFLIAEAIELDWPDRSQPRPSWMRSEARGLVPCDCGTCFWCKHGFTNGVAHRSSAARKKVKLTHEWKDVASNKCGVCINECAASHPSWSLSAVRASVTKHGKLTCLACDSTGRPICKACRANLSASVEHINPRRQSLG